MESAENAKSALAIRRILRFDPAEALDIGPDDIVFDAAGVETVAAECAGIVLADGDEARATSLLAVGARCVLLGEAALLDSSAVGRLVAVHGGARIGIYAPLGRQGVSWSFETISNADFKTVAPSICEPAWEVLKADGAPTGTHAGWWLAALRDLGARQFLVRVDIGDDADLNICAGLMEALGDQLWIGPLEDEDPRLAEWIEFGLCRQLVLSPKLCRDCVALFPADEAVTA